MQEVKVFFSRKRHFRIISKKIIVCTIYKNNKDVCHLEIKETPMLLFFLSISVIKFRVRSKYLQVGHFRNIFYCATEEVYSISIY